jgi:hypothetical protein
MEKSATMMFGYKKKYFKYMALFISISLLGLIPPLTAILISKFYNFEYVKYNLYYYYIYVLFLQIYYQICTAKFYDDIKDNPYIENESN